MTTAAETNPDELLYYRVRAPRTSNAKPPLLILLHGVGSNEEDMFNLAEYLPAQYLIIAARGPFTQGPGRYAWYEVDFSSGKPVINAEQEKQSRNILVQFISSLQSKHNFDPSQIYLGGFSQGAIMSIGAGLTHPTLLKGVVMLSGRILEHVRPAALPSAANLKVFIAHGTQDNVLKVDYARDSRAWLLSKGIQSQYHEYTLGHSINADVIRVLSAWLTTD